MQWRLRELFTTISNSRNGNMMSGVEDALGRLATDFKTRVQKTADSGAWTADTQKEPK
jgi:hypothetical protein